MSAKRSEQLSELPRPIPKLLPIVCQSTRPHALTPSPTGNYISGCFTAGSSGKLAALGLMLALASARERGRVP